jgi:hypothetical protein
MDNVRLPGGRTVGAVQAAAALSGIGIATLVALHLLPRSGGVDPVYQLLSEYPLQDRGIGVAYVLALLSANAAAALAGMVMARSGLLRDRTTTALFAISCASLLGLIVFLKDPAGATATWSGNVHQVCTILTCVSQYLLAVVLWWRYRADPLWNGRARTVGVLAAAESVALIPFVYVFATRSGTDKFAGMAIGLVERYMFVVILVMMIVLTSWAKAMTLDAERRPELVAA